jgi:type II secretory pathway pseudopilin PulG
MTKRPNSDGFTITELAISITVAGFLAAILFITTFYYYANVLQSETSSELALESQTILAQLTEDIRLADAVSSTNAIADANAPVGGWVTSDPSNIIIIENPAVDSSRNIIFNANTGYPYRNEFIYFTSGSNMYKRVLANTSATGNTAVASCPAAKANSSCPSDRLFSANVGNLKFTFYDAANNTTSDASAARSVTLEVDMAKKSFGKTITLVNTTRVTLRNQ